MAENKLNTAAQIAQLVGLVPAFISGYYALWPTPVGVAVPSNGSSISAFSPRLLVSFGIALACFFIGGILSVLSLIQRRRTLATAPSTGDDALTIRFPEAWQKIDYLAAHERGLRWITMLSDTQLELFELARDLTVYLESLGEYPECPEPKTTTSFIEHIISGPGGQWSTRFTAGYEKDFAPRLNKVILYLEQGDGRRRGELRKYKDSIREISHLWELRELIWIEASHISGVELRSVRER